MFAQNAQSWEAAWEQPYHVPALTVPPQHQSLIGIDKGRAPFWSLTTPYHSQAILFGFGRREIHSSERRKPSEVSLRLSMVLSTLAGGLAPAPSSPWLCAQLGHTLLDFRCGVRTMQQILRQGFSDQR